MKTYKIYGLYLESTPEDIRYIGITGHRLLVRLKGHRQHAKQFLAGVKGRENCYRANWIAKHMSDVRIRLLEEFSCKERAAECEVYYIKGYSELGHNLVNTIYAPSNYKDGYKISEKARENMRLVWTDPEILAKRTASIKKYWANPEARLKASETAKANPNRAFLGRKHTKEAIEKTRLGNTGKKHTEEAKNKISAANTKYTNIQQFSAEGEYIKTWPSIKEIENAVGINGSNMRNHLNGKHKKMGGYIWRADNKNE